MRDLDVGPGPGRVGPADRIAVVFRYGARALRKAEGRATFPGCPPLVVNETDVDSTPSG